MHSARKQITLRLYMQYFDLSCHPFLFGSILKTLVYIRAFWEIKIYINIRFWLDIWFNFSTFSIFFLVGRCWCNPTTFLSTPVWLGEGEVPGPWDAVLTCRSDIFRPWETSQSCQCLESTSLLKATYLETQLQCTRSWGRRAPNRRAWVWWTW